VLSVICIAPRKPVDAVLVMENQTVEVGLGKVIVTLQMYPVARAAPVVQLSKLFTRGVVLFDDGVA